MLLAYGIKYGIFRYITGKSCDVSFCGIGNPLFPIKHKMLCEDAITAQWKNGLLYILTFWEETKMLFKILVGILVFVILFLLKGFYDQQKYKDKIQFLLKQEWGMETRDEYSDKIFRNICFYHEQKKKESDIDDITWNDLEMDQIFMLLNHTRTSAGEEYLYHLLRSPLYQEEELDKREQLIEEITKQEDKRYDLEMALCDIGKTDQISVYEFLSLAKELDQLQVKRFPHLIACLAMIGSVVMLPFFPSEMILLLFVVMAVNAYFYYKAKAEMTSYLALFSFILRTIKKCDAISSVDFVAAKNERRRMKELAGKFRKFSRFSFLVSGGSSISGSLFDAVFDYVRILCHVDLIKIGTMIKEVCKYEKELLELYDIIGYLDAIIAIASFRDSVETYCIPQFEMEKEHSKQLKMQMLYHPLIKNPVKNSIDTDKSILFTGSNASGKSTFLKAVAINVLFAQTIHTVLADEYCSAFYRIYSSMALRDDILSQESYFIVELKSLKRIFTKIREDDVAVLCFIDEILRGTNTVERVAASSQLLEEIAKKNALCFAATHDIELTYLLEDIYQNCHFEEVLQDGDVSFDYLLKEGRANSRNAIRLLEVIGFDKEVVKRSQQRVDRFLQKGIWE